MEEQIPAELEHVVERARLGVIAVLGILIEGPRDDVPRAQDLADADAAVAVHAVRHDHVPEVLRGRVKLRLAGLLEDAQVSDELRDVLVGVPAVEHVRIGRDGLVDRVVDEALRGGDVIGAAGPQRRERRQAVADPAVLAGDVRVPHAVELRLRQRRQPAVHPIADLRGDVERLCVARMPMRIEQPGQDLVQCVVRRPDAGIAAVRRELLEPDELRLRVRRRNPGCRRPSVGAMMWPCRLRPDASVAAGPSASSKRYHATLPPPTVPPDDCVSDRTSAGSSVRSKIWNSSTAAFRYGTLRCGNCPRPIQLPFVAPRSTARSSSPRSCRRPRR